MHCTHHYLTNPKTIEQNMGWADFLRGTIFLHQCCLKYNYKFYLNKKFHPIFDYINNHEAIIQSDETNIVELFTNTPLVEEHIIKLFKSNNNNDLHLSTNSFYLDTINNTYTNWGSLNIDTKQFMRDILHPSSNLQKYINYIFNKEYDKYTSYYILHLRLGDILLYNQGQSYDPHIFNYLHHQIARLINKSKLILLSDSDAMAYELKKSYPTIKYWRNNKTHIGDFKHNMNGLKDSLVDFFTITKADKIYYFSNYNHGTGFSESASRIFDIDYHHISEA